MDYLTLDTVIFSLFYKCIYSHLCGHMDIVFTKSKSMMDSWHKTLEWKFSLTNLVVLATNQNLMQRTLGYVGKIQEIIQVDFSSFQCVIFRWKWRDTFDRDNVKEYRDSGLISVNSRKMWHEARESYVVQNIATRCFFYLYVLDKDWWFILRHDPRSKHIFENNNFIVPSKMMTTECAGIGSPSSILG